ncbi:hypothetical protein A2962_03145 [Candidatus Woesebacteria bacterium RIFCSPLOWO2_01_FULL_39_61]|uniref:Glycosyltransferase 2-like domain-containing protein n=1 Tax=Candidatus Woesebacteria bacterium RIFCSPHIGHO2_02_FULL_39_13 TaxID=1802505 RepID=A0A1F7Z3Z0_9BACT|nr:MAG: hypothetical protein A2692_04230 [Candidatus Woesebacteria bacterium RIFCSPHIGHO2_01_FULL_39_95]OGM33819.1 MAG: hypothetical protein A3D01_02515 [Candidatus Woesebacteria bacterium RIFCSPHIGHO2_02_FULL_39_13]OGM38980.1 MAG: hypothetical protein A3E13_04785 [Candidatus Woesebacteria bacterium RIFCSPHIGHO2_12_FULL_40_20]OGM67485.1 MAG: hypothetical protein A2962_03145 [Candidatus Woesebacteria bacterium RIFCSPLOWO2_01_FULL_39_61]OGM72816.1 MAG: hypothetical protein A3H19_05650 [Candidatus
MHDLEVIIPVKNEAESIAPLVERIHQALYAAKVSYRITFVDDHSTDDTTYQINILSEEYPIKLLIKKGKIGKAYSILEGSRETKASHIAMIDGDLQYPPEALPDMYKLLKNHAVVVANRKTYKTSLLRRVGSKVNYLVFERFLHGFKCDTQSGLKVFRKEIIDQMDESDVSAWTLDMPLLDTARQMGFSVGSVDIDFFDRIKGKSKINFVKAGIEIAKGSLALKVKRPKIYKIPGQEENLPLGAGVAYKGRRFTTHSRLPHKLSALYTLTGWQKVGIVSILALVILGFLLNLKMTAIALIALLSFIYFLDLIFSLRVLLKSLHFPPEIKIDEKEIGALKDDDLPIYTILCPLYKEAEILPHFVEAINTIDWPKDKLDIILLLEEDDEVTNKAAERLGYYSYIRTLIVPDSKPKTKPKACNFGLTHARGEYLVIYDAEDRPDPLQLKKAFLAFKMFGDKVVCLQCKLNYYNPNHNLLTRLFTAEYSLWFDLILPGLQSIESVIPLGGTSNHFKTEKLRELHGWDPFNVTEDCDLGARLFKKGYKTALIDSTTYEEANSRLRSWVRQRSRWIKGYIQTYLVHMRNPISFHREFGFNALIFQLVIGMRMVFILVNPILWLATISYFLLYKFVGPAIEALYPAPVFYIAVTSLVFGNFIYFYNYMIGCAKRGQWNLIKFVFLVPFYWLMTSYAATIALYQLLVKPHYWEKTQHGLHLKKAKEVLPEQPKVAPRYAFNPALIGGGALIFSAVVANLSNFIYNAYLGRKLELSEFGIVSLITSLFSLTTVFSAALGKSINYKSAYLLGKYKTPIKELIQGIQGKLLLLSLVVSLVWISGSWFFASFFNTPSPLPFLLFSPLWIVFLIGAVNGGFLMGNFKFIQISTTVILEALVKLSIAYFFVENNRPDLIYSSIPLSLMVSTLLSLFYVSRIKQNTHVVINKDLSFPVGFFGNSILTGVAGVSFLTFDIILAKHFLSAQLAGQYALLSLSGKIIYFLSGLVSQFLIPVISKNEGENKESTKAFYTFFWITGVITLVGYLFIGLLGDFTIPILFGQKAQSIVAYLPLYGMAMVYFVISGVFVTYHQVKGHNLFPIITFTFAIAQAVGIYLNHSSVAEIVFVVSGVSLLQLISITILHFFYDKILTLARNLKEFLGLFEEIPYSPARSGRLNILIFNWRDLKHVWGGGAEVYVEEIAKRWVREGHKVTLFCGNDGKNKLYEKRSGIQVIRRGGFYTIYIWAILNYLLKLKNKFDVVIDSENGIPFFTPLFVSVPKILLIHHVHQDYLRKRAPFPLSYIAKFLELYLMPFAYKNSEIVTISESSKKDIHGLGFKKKYIAVINPGINRREFKKMDKTPYPSFVYIGRLKPYKNVDVAIKALALVKEKYPEAKLLIAGKGESEDHLKKLTQELGVDNQVEFLGYVTNRKRARLMAESWVSLQPSSFEGWGITVIEANAARTPVIASNIKGLRDSVVDGRTGLLVPERNEKVMAKAMLGLIEYSAFREEVTKNAYEWSKLFSWDKSAKEFLKVIIKTIETNKDVIFVRKLALSES